MNHSTEMRKYLPAAGRNWLLMLYDPLTRLFGLQSHYYRMFADVCPADHILDIGCGTGSLARIVKEYYPSVHFVGIDPDLKALKVAKKKLRPFRNIQLDLGFAGALPYATETYDLVLSTFVFHHLSPSERIAMCKEAKRVLKRRGSLRIIDFDPSKKTSGSMTLSILDCLRLAGFKTIETEIETHWPFGAISFYSASVTNF